MLERTAAAFLLACVARAESEFDKSWQNLGHTIRQESYTIATRDRRCATGHVESFDKQSVTVDARRLPREDVIRIGDGTSVDDHDPIYSGRSSWSDLQHAKPNKYEHIRLDLKSGATRDCRNFSNTDQDATCDGAHIEKAGIARGYYVRLAPATEWEHHAARENVLILAPRTWFNFALFPRIAVLLYDADVPEVNSKVECSR